MRAVVFSKDPSECMSLIDHVCVHMPSIHDFEYSSLHHRRAPVVVQSCHSCQRGQPTNNTSRTRSIFRANKYNMTFLNEGRLVGLHIELRAEITACHEKLRVFNDPFLERLKYVNLAVYSRVSE